MNLKNNRNQTPLHLAVTQGHMEMVQLLVSEGCDVNAEDEDGDTAMHIVLERQNLMSVMADERLDDEGSICTKVRLIGWANRNLHEAWWNHTGPLLPCHMSPVELIAAVPPSGHL